MLSIVSAQHNVPFFIAAPTTTLDAALEVRRVRLNRLPALFALPCAPGSPAHTGAQQLMSSQTNAWVLQWPVPSAWMVCITHAQVGTQIEIEQRPSEEITHFKGARVVDERVKVGVI